MTLKIYYDGDCYFCRNYAELVELRNTVGDVRLISVREDTPEVRDIMAAGYNLNTGFVVEHDGVRMSGSEAYSYLSGLMRKEAIFDRMIGWTAGNPNISKPFYPILVSLRMVLLAVQGLALIPPAGSKMLAAERGLGVRLMRLTPLLLALVAIGAIFVGAMIPSFTIRISSFHPVGFTVLAVVSLIAYGFVFVRADLAPKAYWRLRGAGLPSLILFFCIWLLVVNTGELIIERKFLGFVGALPLIGLFVDLFHESRSHKSESHTIGFVAGVFPAFLIAFSLFPGVFVAPFYGGIVGWYDNIDKSRLVEISGYKLVNRDGGEIWHNGVFFQPHTLLGRFRHAYENSGTGDATDFMKFLFSNYKRIYPGLERGRLPHQWALGNLSYPPHSLSHNNASAYVPDFAPERIVRIYIVSEYFDWKGEYVERKIWNEYEVPAEDAAATELTTSEQLF